ncbi:YEATS domain-containing protein 4 [Cichlidogyrus casuarinus]|uniref:YEATS domain-containing protein 4 n=1 Tax=Cichlidogyrus casuarinus TaxID=1844966 RepID=A0ABD2QLF9_9PLAT
MPATEQNMEEKMKTTIVKPIVYGNISRYLGKKRDGDGRTHEWKVFVKPFHANEDISRYIKKVQFKLHESYPNPVRVVSEPPFELCETGWGEFDIGIKLIFSDQNEKPAMINHLIKLFHCDQDIMMGTKSLVREIYDELVFVDPCPSFYRCLMNSSSTNKTLVQHESDFAEAKKQALSSINSLNTRINQAINAYRDQLKSSKDSVEQMRQAVSQTNFSKLNK